jgi:hypothetical protein
MFAIPQSRDKAHAVEKNNAAKKVREKERKAKRGKDRKEEGQ